MPGLKKNQDAYGAAMWDAIDNAHVACVIEREDGFVDVDHTRGYMGEFAKWAKHERRGMRLARGRVLDIGCGLGRVALYLQSKGLEVVAIDNSPLAIAACRRRGVRDARVLPLTRATRQTVGLFDTVVMYGNNFGLLGSLNGGRRLLRQFHAMTGPDGRIIAQSFDPHLPAGQKPRNEVEKAHLAYRHGNVRRGRLPGQIRLRIRYHGRCTPYWDCLFVSRNEMKQMVAGTGWRVAHLFDSSGPNYVAVLEKEVTR